MQVWLNGSLVPAEQARVSVFDHGLTVGDGVFETLQVLGGRPFAPTRHIRRLGRSAELLGLAGPDADAVARAIEEVLAANAPKLGEHGRVRITYTSGEGPAGSDRGPGPGTLIVFAVPGAPWPPTTSIITVPWPRNERGPLAGVKSTSYAENAVALALAKTRGGSEAVFANLAGQLCEGTGSNIFLISGGRVRTPPLSSGCLAGITRELVLEWFEAEEVVMTMADLAQADEVFLTSSTRDIHPVARVDDRTIASLRLSSDLAEAFRQRARENLDP